MPSEQVMVASWPDDSENLVASWHEAESLGEHGTVAVREYDPAAETVDLYRFAVDGRTRRRVRHYRTERERERGANRSHVDTGDGALTGLVLRFVGAHRFTAGRIATEGAQHYPRRVYHFLTEECGVSDIRA